MRVGRPRALGHGQNHEPGPRGPARCAEFKPDGKQVGSVNQRINVTIKPESSDIWHFESLSRILVPPGRYEVRLAIRTQQGKTAGVHTYVTVPNFSTEDLALSGLVLAAAPSPKSAPAVKVGGDALGDSFR